jgi:hypothetical protein
MIEAIIDQEDRELTSSLGNWTGDATWNGGPIHGYFGLMEFVCDPGGPEKTEQLTYSNIRLPKNTSFTLDITTGKDLTVDGLPTLALTLDDGAGHTIDLTPIIEPIYDFQHTYYGFDTPPEWVKEGSTLVITASFPDAAEGSEFIIYFSVQYESLARPQYLPLVGVG